MKDCYEMIGTSREAIVYRSKNATLNEVDEFIKEKYERERKRLERKIELATTQKDRENYEKELNKTRKAFEKINSPILRDIYNRELEDTKRQEIEKKERLPRKKTAYLILGTTRESMERRNEDNNNIFLKRKRDEFKQQYLDMLSGCKNNVEEAIIRGKMDEIDAAYESVKNAEKREKYNKQLDREQEEEIQKIRKLKIERQYSHKADYNPSLIATAIKKENQSLEKMIIRKAIQGEEHFYVDEANRQLSVKQTGKIIFKTSAGYISDINEYKVKRGINGQEKIDTIYTNLNTIELSRNPKTKEIYNPDYYDCVVNELLSEDVIEGSRYNNGYIGEVKKDSEGKYYITLANEKLEPSERESLAAVMTLKKSEKENQIQHKGEEKGR